MKVYIKQTEGYVVDLVTYNPNIAGYDGFVVTNFPSNVCNRCYKLENDEFVLDEEKRAKMEYAALSAVEKLTRMTINSIAITDNQALEVKELFPVWTAGEDYPAGYKLLHGERLFKVRQAVSAIENQQPGATGMGAIYEEINETNAGTQADPIPYDPVAGMEITEGVYYSQNGMVYLCTRSSGQALYHDLSALVGIYVQAAGSGV
jgi:hypothetical protein